jgi:hypothetical protein
MPIARIRTFDPEAVSFLAAKLAASGFQLQFAAPGEQQLEEADLEITVTRMDSATALEQARLQAEEMNVDVTVMPGVLVSPKLDFASVEEVAVEPEEIQQPESTGNAGEQVTRSQQAPWTTPYHADLPDEPQEFITVEAPQTDDSSQPDFLLQPEFAEEEAEHTPSRTQDIAHAAADGLKKGADAVGNFANSSAARLAEWKRRTGEAIERRRAQREQEQAAAMEHQRRQEELAMQAGQLHPHDNPPVLETASFEAEELKPKLISKAPLKSRTLYGRDRRFRNAAVAAALVIIGAMIGWSLAGFAGPANPIRNSLANVQQQTPFGAASVTAPAPSFAATPRPATIAKPLPVHPAPKPAAKRVARTSHTRARHHTVHRSASADDDGEVVVRHFGTKPEAQQAKAKTKDGVKIITEE